ncbi:MAG TPA: hypothetical protein PKM34_10580, partial [Bacteroidales bacterium]|nr:hypothetical protein [Bacteroidales bacterium]
MKRITPLIILMLMAALLIAQQSMPEGKYIADRYIDENGREVVIIIVPGTPPGDHREPAAI